MGVEERGGGVAGSGRGLPFKETKTITLNILLNIMATQPLYYCNNYPGGQHQLKRQMVYSN